MGLSLANEFAFIDELRTIRHLLQEMLEELQRISEATESVAENTPNILD